MNLDGVDAVNNLVVHGYFASVFKRAIYFRCSVIQKADVIVFVFLEQFAAPEK